MDSGDRTENVVDNNSPVLNRRQLLIVNWRKRAFKLYDWAYHHLLFKIIGPNYYRLPVFISQLQNFAKKTAKKSISSGLTTTLRDLC